VSERRLPPVQQLGVVSMILTIVSVIWLASYIPKHPPLTVSVNLSPRTLRDPMLPQRIAGMLAVIPLYVLGLLSSYLSTELITTKLFGQSSGTYHHYFTQFLPKSDIYISFGKVMAFALVIILAHCYYGYKSSGGPAGVGVSVGRAVRMVITTIVAMDLLLDLALYGTHVTVRIAG